jgi:small subunit ribosomal protein S17e
LDFQVNKRICDEVATIVTKRLRNRIAGFTTHLMRRIQKGPVRGISFKLQEEERERKDNYVPEVSALNTESIEVDETVDRMLGSFGMSRMRGVRVNKREDEAENTHRRPFRKEQRRPRNN